MVSVWDPSRYASGKKLTPRANTRVVHPKASIRERSHGKVQINASSTASCRHRFHQCGGSIVDSSQSGVGCNGGDGAKGGAAKAPGSYAGNGGNGCNSNGNAKNNGSVEGSGNASHDETHRQHVG